ncbi:M56 family metallopeptidase [Dyadobacter jiangsuensis]|uniref:Beta-lactamase regulating signal transducer with metallopeptidase domain n=1 Tax=Dyadobacter jiangsuensis TaxID=1591085 RepID=A0A2P8GIX2_9BACT|nr:M56 family metallopeptidase [Dyadobacter jiangsuensis]PSL33915.1 beta-lactamase regulating signal transducer with metallopeptidase domain [Dyadobacter jiangsuensis]
MKNLFTSETTYALIRQIGLALGHSLWIGAVAALLAAAVIVYTRRSRPEIRYNLLTGLLLLFIVGTVVAFVRSGSAVPVETQVRDVSATHLTNEAVGSGPTISHPQSFVGIVTDFLAQNIYTITWLWLLIVAAKMTGLAIGLYRLHQLKTRQIYAIGTHWEQRVREFARTMGITQHVKIFQSGLVKVPTVLGHFKPVILVPLGVITSIPADQIEMVLLHELAHIRRLDFFVNFLQRLTELLFFFNPGILWISRLMHEERENCCDDMALRCSGNQTTYIRALLSFREYQLNENVYQLAFSGKGGLVQRAKRIASRTNSTLGASEKTVLLVAMLAFLTFSVLFAQSDGRQTSPQKPNAKQARQTGNAKNPATAPKNQVLPQPDQIRSKTTENQINNKPNTLQKQAVQNPAGVANHPNLTRPDTLQPLQKTTGALNRLSATLDIDSSANARLAPVQWQPYAQTYQAQPLQTYRQEYRPNPIRIKRQAINEKIMDAIERQGIEISRNNIDFRITNHELIVNGVKQPDSVLKSVLDAVLPKPDDVIDFTYGSHH